MAAAPQREWRPPPSSEDPWKPPDDGREVTTVVTGLQFDRARLLIGDLLPDGFNARAKRFVNPHNASEVADVVHVALTYAEVGVILQVIQDWLIANPIPWEPADVRRRAWKKARTLQAIARRLEVAGRLPPTCSAYLAEVEAAGSDPNPRLGTTRTRWIANEVTQSMRWVERHRSVARALEQVPHGRFLARRVAAGDLAAAGQVRHLITAWWTLGAPTAPFKHLPQPGDDPYESALKWYRAARTVPRLAPVADILDGPTTWARNWSWAFLARCSHPFLAPFHLTKEVHLATIEAWHDAAGDDDFFEGGPMSGIDLLTITNAEAKLVWQARESPTLIDRISTDKVLESTT